MDVPVEARALVEGIVDLGERGTRQGGRQEVEDKVVPEEAECDLMCVVWQGAQRELFGKGSGEVHEEGWGRDRVTHGGGEWAAVKEGREEVRVRGAEKAELRWFVHGY